MMKRVSIYYLLACVVFLAGSSAAAAQGPTAHGTSSVAHSDAGVAARAPAGEPTLEKAEQLYRTGRLTAAEQEYNALIKAEPVSALAYAGLVRVYIKQKRPSDASAAAAKAVELAPALDAAHVALAEAYFRQGKIAEADNEFTTLVKANTKEPRAYLGLSLVYRASSLFKHAKLAIDRAYALDPADPDIRRAWLGTLSLQERIKELQAYLSGETNDDSEERRHLEHQLAILQDEAAEPKRRCRLVTKLRTMETPLEALLTDSTHIRGYGLVVKLNGTSSKLLLDTGAGGILVDRKTAERAGIKRVAQQDVKGIGDKGTAAGYTGYADSIKIGEMEFQDCYVDVIEQSSVVGGNGLIGADFFSRFLVDIDLPNAKLRLSELPPRPQAAGDAGLESHPAGTREFHDRYIAPEMKSFTPIFRFGHSLLIQTRVNDLAPKLFLIDTGGFGNTISPAAAREVTKVSSTNLQVRGLNGSVKEVFRADELTLQFAHLKQTNRGTVSFDTSRISNSIGTEVSGILGFSLLRMLRIKIDYRDGLVDFEYDSKRFH